MGRLGEAYIFASETVALDIVGATYLRSVEPGEIDRGRRTRACARTARSRRSGRAPASSSISISRGRTACSTGTASTMSASGSARSSRWRARSRPTWSCRCRTAACRRRSAMRRRAGIPFELGIIRSHYVGRTFIQPGDHVRHLGVKLKHNANSALIQGKRIVLVDDFDRPRHHLDEDRADDARCRRRARCICAIASPPTRHSCFYGVDTPERAKLLAAQMDVAAMSRLHPRRQPRLRLDRRPLQGARRAGPRRGRAAVLRRLLHRRLSDQPHRPRGSGAPQPARCSRRAAVA